MSETPTAVGWPAFVTGSPRAPCVSLDAQRNSGETLTTRMAVLAAAAKSVVSRAVNIAFVERQNGTDRNRNARKVRKTYCFSKDWDVHAAATYFTMYGYNFCWAVRTLRVKGADDRWRKRTPAMSAGLADHVWSLREWLTFPAIQRE